MTLLKRRETGVVHCKDTAYSWKCLSCHSTRVSPISLTVSMCIRTQFFYGDQIFMETSWKREGTRASKAHCGWNSIVVCLNSLWIWCAPWLYLSKKKKSFCVQTFLLAKQNSNLNVSEVPLVTAGPVESECTVFSEWLFFFTGFHGFDLQDHWLLHIAAVFLRIVFHSQT